MKHMKTRVVPEHTEEVLDYTSCDLCKKKIEWRGSYVVDEVEVRHKTGSHYPEGGMGEETRVDLCGDCFDNKLLPWLQSQGCPAHTRDWDW